MGDKMNKLVKGLQEAIRDADKKKTAAYDTSAKVVRNDGDILWVHIPGGVDETPVRRTINAKPGDEVQVRVANGSAWALGNATNPPTDDTVAVEAKTMAGEAISDLLIMKTVVAEKVDVQELNAVKADICELEVQTAKIEDLTAEQLSATVGYIEDLTAADISASDISADHATIGSLDTTYATISALTADEARITAVEADTAKIHNLTANEISAATGYVGSLTAGNVSASDIIADHATIDSLDSNYAHISNGVIDNAKIGHADVNGLNANYAHITNGAIDNAKIGHADVNGLNANYAHITNGTIDNAKIGHADVNGLNANYAHITNGTIDNAKIGYANVNDLDAHYAEIDLANVDNAWLENGVIKNGAIGDAQIIGVSANKLTAGTIDASNITVTNLNASNITTGTINGQRIGTGSLSLDKLSDPVYTESEIDGMLSTMQAEIDGAIETFTGTVVPTLNNAPASSWTTAADKAKHVGDVYYVVNAASQADGYCYRFAYDTQTSIYSWVLIKDSDVTAALQRLIDAEGDISDLQEFESETSSWISNTNEELSSIKSNHTSLVTVVDKTIKESAQLWFTKANTTAPSKPTAEVTNNNATGSNSYNKWNLAVPQYNASYPNYFYCYQWKYVDNTFGWSAVTRDIAMGESQERARTAIADAATADGKAVAAQSAAETADGKAVAAATAASTADGKAVAAQNTANANIKSTVQLWFTKANTTAPNKPTAHVTNNSATGSNSYNKWNLVVPEYNASYPNYFYCYEYQKGDNTYSWSDVVLDKATTENQANARSALTQVATKVETSTFNTLSQTVDSNTANITSLTSTVETKADSSTVTTLSNTVNEVSQTASGNSSKLSNLTTTLGTNADGTTKANDIVHRTSAVEQDLSGFKTTVSETYQTKSAMEGYYTSSQTDSAINQKAGEITSSVSQTYATKTQAQGYATTAETNAKNDTATKLQSYSTTTQMNSAINQKADAITASVASTYTTKADFDALEIGGRNLLINTGDITKWSKEARMTVSWDDTEKMFRVDSNNGSSRWGIYQIIDIEPSTEYTLTVTGKNDGTPSGFGVSSAISTWPTFQKTFTTDAQRLSYTFTTAAEATQLKVYLEHAPSETGHCYYVYQPKLEKGNKATDWTPAPEDLEAYADSAVTTAKAEIKITTDGISSEVSNKVGNNEVISKINQSSESITIDAGRVNIAGATIFTSGRLSETSLNAAYDANGAASTAQANAISTAAADATSKANAAQAAAEATAAADATSKANTAESNAKSYADTGIISTTTLYYASNSTTAPSKPSAHVTTNSASTRGAWNIALPTYNASYPYLYVCSETKTKGGTYAWTSVEQTTYASAVSAIKTTAESAAPKADAVARTQRIYYRKASSGAPSGNTTWLSTSGTGYGNWSLSIPPLTSGTTKYPYLYTAVQTQTVSQQAAGTTCTCSTVLLDDTTTVIDGGNIITGTVSANAVSASSGTFDSANIPNLNASKITAGDISSDRLKVNSIQAINDNTGTVKINASKVEIDGAAIFSNSNFQTALTGSYSTTEQMNQAISTAVDDIEIGGTNIVPKSVNLKSFTIENASYATATFTDNDVTLLNINARTYGIFYDVSNIESLAEYTLSFNCSAKQGSANVSIGDLIHPDNNGTWVGVMSYHGISVGRNVYTVTIPADCTRIRLYFSVSNANSTVTISKVKLEKGNKATGWSPAPEDELAESQRIYIRSNQSSLNAITAPTSIVTRSDVVNGAWTLRRLPMIDSGNTAYKYCYTCEQLISVGGYFLGTTQVVQDESHTVIDGGSIITQSITAEKIQGETITLSKLTPEAQSDILNSNIEIGGTNLSLNSGDLTKWVKEGGSSVEWDAAEGMWKVATTKTSSRWGIYQYVQCEPNTTYTFSLTGKTPQCAFKLCVDSYTSASGLPASYYGDFTNTTSRLSCTFTTGAGTSYIRMYIVMFPTQSGTYVYAYQPKLEKGNKATDWSPAPQDVDSAISAVQAAIPDVSGKADKTAAIAEEQRIYYRSSSSTKPNGNGLPTAWVTETGDKYNSNATTSTGWSRKVTPIASGTGSSVTKYLYLWTCIQKKTVSGTVTYGDILLDDSTTIIDGGKIVTGSVSANAVSASSGTFNEANIPNLNADKITAGDIAADRMKVNSINAINSLTTGKIDAERLNVGQITVSSLSDGSSYSTTSAMNQAIGDAVDNIKIGGDNLIPHTDLSETEYWGYNTANATVSNGRVTVPSAGEYYQSYTRFPEIPEGDRIQSGEELTISCYFYENTVMDGNSQLYYSVSPSWRAIKVPYGFTGLFVKTFNSPITITRFCAEYDIRNKTAGQWVCGPIKLERGNKATDWTRSSKDVYEELSDKKSIHTVNTNYSFTYSTLLYYANEGYTGTWTITPNTDGIKAGDTVRIKCIASDMNNAPVYIVGTVESVNSSTIIYVTSHGLDTTVIDGGHILTGTIDANNVNVANLTVGAFTDAVQAEIPWTSNVEKTPYLLRKSGSDIDHAFTAESGHIVGGTVAWNQFGKEFNATNWSVESGVTVSFNAGEVTFTSTTLNNGIKTGTYTGGEMTKNGHKYLVMLDAKIATASNDPSINMIGSGMSAFAGSWTLTASYNTYSKVVICSRNDPFSVYIYAAKNSALNNAISIKNFNIFDLTQMFGSTIADYIYSLETATAGAGVEWFRKLFNKPYYAYNAEELMSVSGLSSHDMTGFNQWDEEWEVYGSSQIKSKNLIPLIPNTTYYLKAPAGIGATLYFKEDTDIPSSSSWSGANETFTVPSNIHYAILYAGSGYGTIYNHDICINLAGDNSRNGEYEPYTKHSYQFDSSIELRGVLKLDANNKPYYDGDIYESSGVITRKYAKVDLGSLSWNAGSGNVFYATFAGLKYVRDNVVVNAICDKYLAITKNAFSADTSVSKTFRSDNATAILYFRDLDYSSAASFKAAVDGTYLIYELAKPTTETATPYANPQLVDSYGTEEYVTTGIVPVGHETTYAYSPTGTGITAEAYSSRYITAIDENGIRVHPQGNSANYTQIDADGMEVIKDSVSVAQFGISARIGQEAASRVELSPTSISLVADTGLPALKSETSSVAISGVAPLYTYSDTMETNSTTTYNIDLSDIETGDPFYVELKSLSNYTVLYPKREGAGYVQATKIVHDDNAGGGVSVDFTKASSGSAVQKTATISVVTDINYLPKELPNVRYTFEQKSITVTYTPPNTISITIPTYTSSLPEHMSTYYGTINQGVTGVTFRIEFCAINYIKTIDLPMTEIYGRCYLELNSDGDVPDEDDYDIVQLLTSKGWHTDCLV